MDGDIHGEFLHHLHPDSRDGVKSTIKIMHHYWQAFIQMNCSHVSAATVALHRGVLHEVQSAVL